MSQLDNRHMLRRLDMLEGRFTFPQQIHQLVKATEADREQAEAMMQSLWHLFITGRSTTSLPYWADKFKSKNVFNRYLMHLSKAGWILSVAKKPGMRNWAEVQFNPDKAYRYISREEVVELIQANKFKHYVMGNTTNSSPIAGGTKVKLPSGIKRSGLVRFGAAKAGHRHEFKYDTKYLIKYKEPIITYTVKSIIKMEAQLGYELSTEEEIDYRSVAIALINYHIDNPDTKFTLGKVTLDSRGRSIYNALKKVFNPIANKIARALIVMPEYSITTPDLKEIYLFIAEILYGHNYDINAKVKQGRDAYHDRKLLDLDLTNEKDIDDLYENIWLDRVYTELDGYFKTTPRSSYKFTVPGELDFSSSNMVLIGCLLNDKTLLTEYMWDVKGLSKNHVKKVQTPYVFGSTAPITSLWRKAGLDYTTEQLRIMKYEMDRGKFAVANGFKDLIINNCNLTQEMKIQVWNEEFTIECNRYKNIGDVTKGYQLFDSATGKIQLIKHTNTHREPDLAQFKRYPVTGIIHNADSQLMNHITHKLTWCVPIYDACVLGFNEFRTMRTVGTAWLERFRANRQDILTNYFKSIGFRGHKPLMEYNKLKAKVTPYEGALDPYHVLK